MQRLLSSASTFPSDSEDTNSEVEWKRFAVRVTNRANTNSAITHNTDNNTTTRGNGQQNNNNNNNNNNPNHKDKDNTQKLSIGREGADKRSLTASVVVLVVFLLLSASLLWQLSTMDPPHPPTSTPTPPSETPHVHHYAGPTWEKSTGVSINYNLVVVNALPYADDPLDSTVRSVYVRGMFSDLTSLFYPVCTFTRVCATPNHILLSIHNYSVYHFYSLVLPSCHDTLYRAFELCSCFHAGFRAGLLPYAFSHSSDSEREEQERVGELMIMRRFGSLPAQAKERKQAGWDTREWGRPEGAGINREIPTIEELNSRKHLVDATTTSASIHTLTSTVASWANASMTWLTGLFSKKATGSPTARPRLYPDPFSEKSITLPAQKHKQQRKQQEETEGQQWQGQQEQQQQQAADASAASTPSTTSSGPNSPSSSSTSISAAPVSSPPLSIAHYAGHFWSIDKWVLNHHIAHWIQKLLMLYASYSHYAHACRHTYKRMISHFRDTMHVWTPVREKVSQSLRGRKHIHLPAEISEYMDSEGDEYNPLFHGLHEYERDDRDGSYTLYHMPCLPPLSGIVFHDTTSSLTDHERSLFDVTLKAMQKWIEMFGLGERETTTSRSSTSTSTTTTTTSIATNQSTFQQPDYAHLPGFFPFSSIPHVNSAPPPPTDFAFTVDFDLTHSILYANDLFQLYGPSGRNPDFADLFNHTELSCFDHLSMSPMFGSFGTNAYDIQVWRETAEHYYHLSFPQPRPHRDLSNIRLMVTPDAQAAEYEQLGLTVHHDDEVTNRARWEFSAKPQESSFYPPASVPIELHPALLQAHRLHTCPPHRVLIITRPDRAIRNLSELRKLLSDVFNLQIRDEDIIEINTQTSSIEQARLFANAGLILSAHSSQLVNILFTQENAAVIEITPEFYNIDFSQYATSLGLYFRYALGGVVENAAVPADPLVDTCLSGLWECQGDNFCIAQKAKVFCKQHRHFPNKNNAFHCNLTSVVIAVKQAIGHLMHRCYGRWQAIHLTTLTPE